jgi:hypothetical protein
VTENELAAELQSVIGGVIVGIGRLYYSFRGTLDTGAGPVFFQFTDGRQVRLESGSDWTLRVFWGAWEDPFPEKDLSPENRRFVETSGKWTDVDVSAEPAYAVFIGAALLNADPIIDHSSGIDEVVGVRLVSTAGVISARCGDELRVELTPRQVSEA